MSEIVALTWSDVLAREEGRVQLSITGKGGMVRQVLLPAIVSRALLSLRGDAGANDPVFASRKGANEAPHSAGLLGGRSDNQGNSICKRMESQ